MHIKCLAHGLAHGMCSTDANYYEHKRVRTLSDKLFNLRIPRRFQVEFPVRTVKNEPGLQKKERECLAQLLTMENAGRAKF